MPSNTAQVIFICAADITTGLGHVFRCLTLARSFRAAGIESRFILTDHFAPAVQLLRGAGFPVLGFGPDVMLSNSASVAILDLVHGGAEPAWISGWLNRTLPNVRHSLFFDGLAPLQFQNIADGLITYLVVPYVSQAPVLVRGTRLLHGPAYLPLNPAFQLSSGEPKLHLPFASRILVSMGGADPTNLTLPVLEALKGCDAVAWQVQVIIGPGFAPQLRGDIEKLTKGTRHQFELVHAPPCLYEHMVWSDLAISASGLTKYELAMAGCPMVLLSSSKLHDTMNSDFRATGACVDLGFDPLFDPMRIRGEILNIASDLARREIMSVKGRQLVDGLGAVRLTQIVHSLLDGQK